VRPRPAIDIMRVRSRLCSEAHGSPDARSARAASLSIGAVGDRRYRVFADAVFEYPDAPIPL
jgi:hypothetical protein